MEKGYRINRVIIDTGIVYALSDKKDAWHVRSVEFITKFSGTLIIPSCVIPETCYLLNKYLGQEAEVAFINSLANKEMAIENVAINDLTRCVELLKRYDNLNIGFVDAILICISERLKITRILTTDRRHFSVIKPRHCNSYILLP